MLRSNPSGAGVWDAIYSQHDRLFADKVMTEADWHRRRKATHRHRLQPATLFRVMLGYFPLLLWVAVLSVAVGLYDITLVKWFHWPMLSILSVQTFFGAITFALTLLLVFKTNSSYARWWEARKDVGQLVSFAHNIMRQAVAYFPPHQAHLMHAMARWASASMWVGKALVRQGAPLREELQGVLTPEELTWLLAQPHKQLALGQALSTIVAAADIDPMTKTRMDSMLTTYTFTFGAFGRIFNTAIPSAYTRHTSRFLMCYILIGLPLLLWPLAGWSSPVLAVLIAFLLLGIENIGSFIEEPFHVIAFDRFCVAVQRDIQHILAMHDNSQCACGPLRSGPQAVVGGNVPVIRDLTYHPAAASARPPPATHPVVTPSAAPTACTQAVVKQSDATGLAINTPPGQKPAQMQCLHAGVEGGLPWHGLVEPAQVKLSGSTTPLPAEPSGPALSGQLDSSAARGIGPGQGQQQVVSSTANLLQPSDSQVCLLSAHAHSHAHRE